MEDRREAVREIAQRLRRLYGDIRRPLDPDPFRTLIRTILSQNSSYKNEVRAFRRLDEEIGVEPRRLAEADVGRIADCVRPAGQHRQRALRIKEVARRILEEHEGDLWGLLRDRPLEEARAELMRLPGVGRKTADIVLLFSARRHVFPIDRHILRIFSRLGLLGPRPDYEDIRRLVEEVLPTPEDLLFLHLALIRFGREVCRAQRPRCPSCPLADLCGFSSRA